MKRREREDIPQERDRHLDVPGEANRDKHINFLDDDVQGSGSDTDDNDSPFFVPGTTPMRDRSGESGDRA